MSHTIIDLPSVRDDGRLYRDTALNFVESLIPNPWNSCHAPDLLELENGDLLCCWFAGSCEGNADVSIAVSRLSEDSSQWETPVIVSDDPTRSEQNPSLFLHPNGEIWLMYTAQVSRDPNNPTSDNLQGTAEIRRKISRDNGHTWEATETMFSAPGSFCRQKTFYFQQFPMCDQRFLHGRRLHRPAAFRRPGQNLAQRHDARQPRARTRQYRGAFSRKSDLPAAQPLC